MIDTLEQFEQAEEAIAKMKRFLLAVRRPHTPEAYRALSAPILRELQNASETFSSISADLQKWWLAIKGEQTAFVPKLLLGHSILIFLALRSLGEVTK